MARIWPLSQRGPALFLLPETTVSSTTWQDMFPDKVAGPGIFSLYGDFFLCLFSPLLSAESTSNLLPLMMTTTTTSIPDTNRPTQEKRGGGRRKGGDQGTRDPHGTVPVPGTPLKTHWDSQVDLTTVQRCLDSVYVEGEMQQNKQIPCILS